MKYLAGFSMFAVENTDFISALYCCQKTVAVILRKKEKKMCSV
jgi:hypothetical protein